MKPIPKWKKFLKYINDRDGNVVTTNECIDAGLVTSQKALNNMLYYLEKHDMVHWYSFDDDGLHCYDISLTPIGRIAISNLGQPQENEVSDDGFAIEVNGKTVLSMSKEDASKALEAIKTLASIFKTSVKES